ncbi:MAG: TFIIB-type zinc ribbon-containing protein [Candidatus Bathyarchaeia archaeon]
MSAERCPECGGTLIRDGATGEVACGSCGTVFGESEMVHSFAPKTLNRGSFAFAGLSETGKITYSEAVKYSGQGRYVHMLRRSDGSERVVVKVAVFISNLASRIGAPTSVEEEAMVIARRLLKAAKAKGRRLTADEAAAVSLWQACKKQGFPIAIDDYEGACAAMLPTWRGSLLRLMSRVCDIERLPFSKFSLKDYVKMFTRKLRKNYTDVGRGRA